MATKTRFFSTAMAFVLALGTLLSFGAAKPAQASEKTWKIATYALGAGTIYALAKNKDTLALVGGLGTAYSAKRWKDAANSRRNQQRRRTTYRSYRRR